MSGSGGAPVTDSAVARGHRGGWRATTAESRGFTFIELMVVVAIMGLLLGFVVLRLDDMVPSSRLSAAARQVASHVGMARGEAVAAGKVHAIAYDLTRQQYAVLTPPDPEEVEAGRYKADELLPLEWETLPSGVTLVDVDLGDRALSSGLLTLRFTPLGTATPHAVHLKNVDGGEMTVVVNPLTGLVDIEPGITNLSLFAEAHEFGGGLSGSDF